MKKMITFLLCIIICSCRGHSQDDNDEMIIDIAVYDAISRKPISYNEALSLGHNNNVLCIFKYGYKPIRIQIFQFGKYKDIFLEHGAVLTGRITDIKSNPVQGIEIRFPKNDYIYISCVILGETDENGTFSIPDIRGINTHIDLYYANKLLDSVSLDKAHDSDSFGALQLDHDLNALREIKGKFREIQGREIQTGWPPADCSTGAPTEPYVE